MKQVITSVVLAGLMLAQPVSARSVATTSSPPAIPGCTMNETASIAVNINRPVESARKAKEVFDAMIASVQSHAKEQQIDTVTIQSMNYSINPNQYGNTVTNYMLSGNVSFAVAHGDKAIALMEKLNAEGLTASLNVNAYQNGNCARQ
jgi:uncharacterized protein YggE